MRAALIGGNSKSSQWTVAAMRKYFGDVDHLYIKHIDINFSGKKVEVLYKGQSLEQYDCIYIKGSFRYAELLRALADLYSEDEGVYLPFQPFAYTVAHDKLLTQLTLQKKNIPMPRTYLTATTMAARDLLASMNYPIIMKFPHGTQGKGVMFADSFASASSILDALDALKQPFIIQEYIETDASDIRLFVVGSRVVAAFKRKSMGSEIRSNIHAGGVGEPFIPDDYMKKLAVDVARTIGADICGVDILEGPTGPLVLEANLSPGLQGITKVTKVDVADRIAKFLFERTKTMLDKRKDSKTREIMAELNNGTAGHEMITQLDFRGSRVLLPEVVTKWTGFSEHEDVQIKLVKGKLVMKKFM